MPKQIEQTEGKRNAFEETADLLFDLARHNLKSGVMFVHTWMMKDGVINNEHVGHQNEVQTIPLLPGANEVDLRAIGDVIEKEHPECRVTLTEIGNSICLNIIKKTSE